MSETIDHDALVTREPSEGGADVLEECAIEQESGIFEQQDDHLAITDEYDHLAITEEYDHKLISNSERANVIDFSDCNRRAVREWFNVKDTTSKRWIGVVVAIFMVVSNVAGVELNRILITTYSFKKPVFLTYFHTSFMMMCMAIQGLIYCSSTLGKCQKLSISGFSKSIMQGTSTTISLQLLLLCALPLTIFWLGANCSFTYALRFTNISTALSLEQTSTVLIFIFSIVLLKEKITFLKITATFIMIVGGIILGLQTSPGSSEVTGIIMLLVSTVFVAMYMVFYKWRLGEIGLGAMNLLLSLIGANTFASGWIVLALLDLLDIEKFGFPNSLVGNILLICGSICGLLFNWCINWGIILTSPLFMRVAMMCTIPLSYFVDFIIAGESFDLVRFVGSMMIAFGFLLFVIGAERMFHFELAIKRRVLSICESNGGMIQLDLFPSKT